MFLANDVQQMVCNMYLWKEVYIHGDMKQPNRKVNIFFPSHSFSVVRCGCECHTITNIAEAVNNTVKQHRDTSEYVFTDNAPMMVTNIVTNWFR